MNVAHLPTGALNFDSSGSGQPIVFLHGFLQDSRIWQHVTDELSSEFHCITPTLPLGAHRSAMHPKVDLSIAGVAGMVAELLDALDLRDVTLVGNDTGGAIAQIVAARHSERLGRLVITSCEAFDNFIPAPLRTLPLAARAGLLSPIIFALRLRAIRRLPNGYGWLTRGPLPHALIDEWVNAYFADQGVRRDARAFMSSFNDHGLLNQIATELASFTKPTLIAWAGDDKLFAPEYGRRLAETIDGAEYALIEDSRTWVMRDQPKRTSAVIRAFMKTPLRAALDPHTV